MKSLEIKSTQSSEVEAISSCYFPLRYVTRMTFCSISVNKAEKLKMEYQEKN